MQWRAAAHAVQWNDDDGKMGDLKTISAPLSGLFTLTLDTLRSQVAKEGKIVVEIEKRGSLTGFPGPRDWSCMYFSVTRWNVTFVGTAHGTLLRLAGQAAFVHSQRTTSSMVILHEYTLTPPCFKATNQFGVTKLLFFPGTNTLKGSSGWQ